MHAGEDRLSAAGGLRLRIPAPEAGNECHTEQPHCQEETEQQEPILRRILTAHFSRQDGSGKQQEGKRQAAVKPPQLRAQPRVEVAMDLPAVVRIRALRFGITGVAHMRGRAVGRHSARMIDFATLKSLALWAHPNIEAWMILKSHGGKTLRELV